MSCFQDLANRIGAGLGLPAARVESLPVTPIHDDWLQFQAFSLESGPIARLSIKSISRFQFSLKRKVFRCPNLTLLILDRLKRPLPVRNKLHMALAMYNRRQRLAPFTRRPDPPRDGPINSLTHPA